jgi:hypothetical protein
VLASTTPAVEDCRRDRCDKEGYFFASSVSEIAQPTWVG